MKATMVMAAFAAAISAYGAVPQQEEPAVLPAEIRGHVLRRNDALRPLPPRVGGHEENSELTGKKSYNIRKTI